MVDSLNVNNNGSTALQISSIFSLMFPSLGIDSCHES